MTLQAPGDTMTDTDALEAPGDDLVERLRRMLPLQSVKDGKPNLDAISEYLRNSYAIRQEAAARIAALTAERDENRAIGDGWHKRWKAAEAANAKLREALEWYGEQARLARLIHSGGDAGRYALQEDGGKRARAALTTEAKP